MRLQSARRLVREPNAPEKLAVIARLQRRYIECRLPKESESRVEQSFNEQLFAKVFGYQTLLSHERLPYHLRPKNYARAVGRYDDFSLGIFWGDERDLVAVTAEFKDPGTDLDAPQTDRREKISAVEQAFRVARGFPSCLSVIVSNFRELRLYRVADQRSPIATFDLHEVRTPRQLAMLCAHFDYDALLGRTGTADMTIALNPSHPSAPIAPTENAFRVICNFTPPPTGLSMPLTILYDAVRETAIELLKVERDEFDRSPKVPITLEDGWVSVETAKVRLAMSAEGQIRCSIRHPRLSGPAQINPDAGFWSIAHDLRDFLRIVILAHGRPEHARCARPVLVVAIHDGDAAGDGYPGQVETGVAYKRIQDGFEIRMRPSHQCLILRANLHSHDCLRCPTGIRKPGVVSFLDLTWPCLFRCPGARCRSICANP